MKTILYQQTDNQPGSRKVILQFPDTAQEGSELPAIVQKEIRTVLENELFDMINRKEWLT